MKETPILFSGAMVRAILSGAKTQTRRPVKPQPASGWRGSPFSPSGLDDGHGRAIKPPCVPGDLGWVRETWAAALNRGAWGTLFSADGAFVQGDKHHTSGPFYDATQGPALKWRPSIHMPRWASRITLPVVAVRIERVQNITAEDAQAEGVTVPRCGCEVCSRGIVICPADATSYIEGFRDLWAATYGRESWEANPWVWVLRWEKAEVRK